MHSMGRVITSKINSSIDWLTHIGKGRAGIPHEVHHHYRHRPSASVMIYSSHLMTVLVWHYHLRLNEVLVPPYSLTLTHFYFCCYPHHYCCYRLFVEWHLCDHYCGYHGYHHRCYYCSNFVSYHVVYVELLPRHARGAFVSII
jgi:hypothetical protein